MNVASITAFADARPEMSAEGIGRALAAKATRSQLLAMAEAYIADTVDRVRRDRAREIEQEAYMSALPGRLAALEQAEADRRREAAEATEGGYQQLFSDPMSYPGNLGQRRDFRRWAGDRFGEWYERGHAAASAAGYQARDMFESDWHPDGPSAYWRERRRKDVWELVEAESERMRLKTTRELLSTVFALGDGTRVTWGDATTAQHRQRIEMLTTNAAGIVETAARHRAAVRMIEDSGVNCLNELGTPLSSAA